MAEASWGADPLELYGGFRSLSYKKERKFRSSLAYNGTTSWFNFSAVCIIDDPIKLRVISHIGFPNVDWILLQNVYGWAAHQYQAWARGTLNVHSQSREFVILNIQNILELWVDDEHYFGGDYYGYERAPIVLSLNPGPHRIDVRLIYDVRLMGGISNPTMTLILDAEISAGDLAVVADHLLAPDVVDDKLSSHLVSVTLRNESPYWLTVQCVESMTSSLQISLRERSPFRLAPGQSRPLAFEIHFNGPLEKDLSFRIAYLKGSERAILKSSPITHKLSHISRLDPHRITFSHPSGIVSYAIVRAPNYQLNCSQRRSASLPLILSLHGAGVDIAKSEFSHVFDNLSDICAWLVMPSGVTTWSGDDWHAWGLADAEAAIGALSSWIVSVSWNGSGVDVSRWLVNGHSNGGQGTWHVLTHRPDNIVAAAPLSGYTSIENYVPYQFWHAADPRLMALISSALSSYKHERLLANLKGIPIMQQHGGQDDNVPAYHSRLMRQLLEEHRWFSSYIELSREGHWFEGIMTTPALKEFYQHYLHPSHTSHLSPGNFSITVADPGDMGSRHGFRVEQLQTIGKFGHIKVDLRLVDQLLIIRTTNIRRFRFTPKGSGLEEAEFIIDDQSLHINTGLCGDGGDSYLWFLRKDNSPWTFSCSPNWTSRERRPRQMGGLHAIMRARQRFRISSHSPTTYKIGLQISRNLFQYFGADTELGEFGFETWTENGNLIRVAMGVDRFPKLNTYPLRLREGKYFSIQFEKREIMYLLEEGMGAIFLLPSGNDTLELVIWGFDEDGLRRASRLFPTLTGVGQPDFIFLSRECSYNGLDGILAAGFFGNEWEISTESYFK
ncbi:alpha/beta-hydrolase [Xylona heveae TC161]|uniref:Alpha/beta-hydrolase n=1 Tax=Xylona heveae (strain CBS 132557 / TC161) TaxID=1328760 RepID=A0A165AKT8_XYLHT|nr:alpha/beta-hydrolase [Xylona heveae TC161]KZF20652.1 alpha/beta-hydrolase [Xylona heveae TC161]